MHARTTVACSPDFDCDKLWLNGVQESVEDNQRLKNCLQQVGISISHIFNYIKL